MQSVSLLPLQICDPWRAHSSAARCYEIHQKALDIEAGRKIDSTFYSVIYGADKDEDWTDPKVWKKANPSLCITVGIDKVRAAHGDHPVLRWMVDNIFIRQDPAGNVKMDKEKSTEKIDGAVAMVMALDRAIRCGANAEESIYDKRGLIFL